MTTTSETPTTTQVYCVYIKATPEAIWDATEPFRAASEAQGFELPEVIIDGEVVEADPPHKLVTTFHMHMDPGVEAEGVTRITHEIREGENGEHLTHDR